jgi:hypothetical protein
MKLVFWIAAMGSGLVARAIEAQPPAPAARPVVPTSARLPEGAVKLQAPRPTTGVGGARGPTIKLPLAVEGIAAEHVADALRVTSGAGKITRGPAGEPALEVSSAGTVILSSEPAKASAAKSPISEREKTQLPWLVVEARRSATGTTLRAARPFLKLARAILWNGSTRRHEAEFLFGLDAETGDPGPLDNPVAARFAVTCDEVTPPEATLSKVGPSGYGTIQVGCSPAVKNEHDEQHIDILLDRGNLSYPFSIPHHPGAPILESDHGTVFGFGFGAPELTVSSVEEDGSPLVASDALPVRFVVSEGSLALDPLTIARGEQRAATRVHPSGIGTVKLTAVLREMPSHELTIALTLPVLPVSSMLVGGATGGAAVLAWTSWKNDWKKALARVAKGAGTGLLVAALALVLPSATGLPNWAPRTELGLFVLSAFAGFLGTPLLRRAAGLLFPGFGRGKEDGSATTKPA